MTLEYPVQGWRSWARTELTRLAKDEDSSEKTNDPSTNKLKSNSEETKAPSNTFTLFIRLPNWEKDSSRKVPEIRTLRNLHNGIEAFQVKAALELPTGLPAHVTTLHDVKDEKILDDARLVLGINITNGSSCNLQVLGAWEEIIKSACANGPSNLLYNLSSQQTKNRRNIPQAWQEFASIVEKSGRENAFCALFAVSARGNVSACKAILQSGVADINQTTFFGNTCLHCAAFNGHLEIIKLLVGYGSDIRCRNADGKSPLDLAAASSYIECARWLWLNQWSISITKSSPNPSPPSAEVPSAETLWKEALSSSIGNDTSSLRKPSPPALNELSGIAAHHGKEQLKSPLFYRRAKHVSTARPKSSPFDTKFDRNAVKRTQSLPTRNHWNSNFLPPNILKTNLKRPQTAFVKSSSASNESSQKSTPVPHLLPQIQATIKRERSIPSVQESRASSHTVGHLHVDIKPATADNPLEVNLDREWVNPKQESYQHRLLSKGTTAPTPYRSKTASGNRSSSYLQQLENIQQQRRNHGDKPVEKPVTPIKVYKKIHISLKKPVEDRSPTDSAADSYENLHSGSHSPRWYNNEAKNVESPVTMETSAPQRSGKVKPNSAYNSASKPTEKRGAVVNENNETQKQENRRTSRDKLSNPEAIRSDEKVLKAHNVVSNKESHPPLSPTKEHLVKAPDAVIKNEHYDRFKRESQSREKNTQDAHPTREELIRSEKNKTAWNDWLAAKHREKLAQRKAEEHRKNEHAVHKWGMTFEQWLDTKRQDLEKKTALIDAEKAAKKHRSITSGKTFEAWLKEKAQEKTSSSEAEDQKLKEEENRKMEEARRRSFAVWSEKKLKEANEERRKSELEEQKKLSGMQEMHEKWKSKERVVSFEAWRKKKEKSRKLSLLEEAQKDAKVQIDSWTAEERRELAERKYKNWIHRKESLYLQEAEKELNEARALREKAERKAKMRKAMLRAKALMKLKAMSKSNPELRRKKKKSIPSSPSPSVAKSAGNDADNSQSSDETSFMQEELEIFSPMDEYEPVTSLALSNPNLRSTFDDEVIEEEVSERDSKLGIRFKGFRERDITFPKQHDKNELFLKPIAPELPKKDNIGISSYGEPNKHLKLPKKKKVSNKTRRSKNKIKSAKGDESKDAIQNTKLGQANLKKKMGPNEAKRTPQTIHDNLTNASPKKNSTKEDTTKFSEKTNQSPIKTNKKIAAPDDVEIKHRRQKKDSIAVIRSKDKNSGETLTNMRSDDTFDDATTKIEISKQTKYKSNFSKEESSEDVLTKEATRPGDLANLFEFQKDDPDLSNIYAAAELGSDEVAHEKQAPDGDDSIFKKSKTEEPLEGVSDDAESDKNPKVVESMQDFQHNEGSPEATTSRGKDFVSSAQDENENKDSFSPHVKITKDSGPNENVRGIKVEVQPNTMHSDDRNKQKINGGNEDEPNETLLQNGNAVEDLSKDPIDALEMDVTLPIHNHVKEKNSFIPPDRSRLDATSNEKISKEKRNKDELLDKLQDTSGEKTTEGKFEAERIVPQSDNLRKKSLDKATREEVDTYVGSQNSGPSLFDAANVAIQEENETKPSEPNILQPQSSDVTCAVEESTKLEDAFGAASSPLIHAILKQIPENGEETKDELIAPTTDKKQSSPPATRSSKKQRKKNKAKLLKLEKETSSSKQMEADNNVVNADLKDQTFKDQKEKDLLLDKTSENAEANSSKSREPEKEEILPQANDVMDDRLENTTSRLFDINFLSENSNPTHFNAANDHAEHEIEKSQPAMLHQQKLNERNPSVTEIASEDNSEAGSSPLIRAILEQITQNDEDARASQTNKQISTSSTGANQSSSPPATRSSRKSSKKNEIKRKEKVKHSQYKPKKNSLGYKQMETDISTVDPSSNEKKYQKTKDIILNQASDTAGAEDLKSVQPEVEKVVIQGDTVSNAPLGNTTHQENDTNMSSVDSGLPLSKTTNITSIEGNKTKASSQDMTMVDASPQTIASEKPLGVQVSSVNNTTPVESGKGTGSSSQVELTIAHHTSPALEATAEKEETENDLEAVSSPLIHDILKQFTSNNEDIVTVETKDEPATSKIDQNKPLPTTQLVERQSETDKNEAGYSLQKPNKNDSFDKQAKTGISKMEKSSEGTKTENLTRSKPTIVSEQVNISSSSQDDIEQKPQQTDNLVHESLEDKTIKEVDIKTALQNNDESRFNAYNIISLQENEGETSESMFPTQEVDVMKASVEEAGLEDDKVVPGSSHLIHNILKQIAQSEQETTTQTKEETSASKTDEKETSPPTTNQPVEAVLLQNVSPPSTAEKEETENDLEAVSSPLIHDILKQFTSNNEDIVPVETKEEPATSKTDQNKPLPTTQLVERQSETNKNEAGYSLQKPNKNDSFDKQAKTGKSKMEKSSEGAKTEHLTRSKPTIVSEEVNISSSSQDDIEQKPQQTDNLVHESLEDKTTKEVDTKTALQNNDESLFNAYNIISLQKNEGETSESMFPTQEVDVMKASVEEAGLEDDEVVPGSSLLIHNILKQIAQSEQETTTQTDEETSASKTDLKETTPPPTTQPVVDVLLQNVSQPSLSVNDNSSLEEHDAKVLPQGKNEEDKGTINILTENISTTSKKAICEEANTSDGFTKAGSIKPQDVSSIGASAGNENLEEDDPEGVPSSLIHAILKQYTDDDQKETKKKLSPSSPNKKTSPSPLSKKSSKSISKKDGVKGKSTDQAKRNSSSGQKQMKLKRSSGDARPSERHKELADDLGSLSAVKERPLNAQLSIKTTKSDNNLGLIDKHAESPTIKSTKEKKNEKQRSIKSEDVASEVGNTVNLHHSTQKGLNEPTKKDLAEESTDLFNDDMPLKITIEMPTAIMDYETDTASCTSSQM